MGSNLGLPKERVSYAHYIHQFSSWIRRSKPPFDRPVDERMLLVGEITFKTS